MVCSFGSWRKSRGSKDDVTLRTSSLWKIIFCFLSLFFSSRISQMFHHVIPCNFCLLFYSSIYSVYSWFFLINLMKAGIGQSKYCRLFHVVWSVFAFLCSSVFDFNSIFTVARRDKTLPRIQNISLNPKTRPRIRNTSQNPKTLPRIRTHFPESKARSQHVFRGAFLWVNFVVYSLYKMCQAFL